MKDLKERLAATGQLLIRSATEIAHLLQALCASGAPLTATLESGEQLFLSGLLAVDSERRHIVIACSTTKHANSAMLAAPLVLFGCNHDGIRYEFAAKGAQEAEHLGAPALKLSFPEALIAMQRRARPRIGVPAGVPLRCIVSAGALSFETRVVDISMQGLGSIVYDPAIQLEPGTRLDGRIIHPQRGPVAVELLVRNVVRQTLPDGSYALRAGCSFVGTPVDIEDLIKLFISDLAG